MTDSNVAKSNAEDGEVLTVPTFEIVSLYMINSQLG